MERLRSLFRWQDVGKSPLLSNASQRADPAAAADDGQNVDLYSTEGSIGIKVIAEPDNSHLDIVFVHGLTGNRENTWTHKNGVFWPRLLADDIQNARIMTFGYDADVVKLWSMAGSNTLRHNGTNLAYAVSDRRRECKSRPIIFIAHSLGGLVCEQALLVCREDIILENVLRSTLGIIFMGTPHAGSDLAEWGYKIATYLNVVRKTNSEIMGVLKQRSEVLSAVQQQFQKLLQKDEVNIGVYCFFEEKAVVGVGTIVPQQSAVLNQFPCQSIAANHMDMTKFSGKNDDGYQRVLGRVRDFTDLMKIPAKRRRQTMEETEPEAKRLKYSEETLKIDFQPSFPGDSGTSLRVQKEGGNGRINSLANIREDPDKNFQCHRAFRTSDYERFKDRNPAPTPDTCQWLLQHHRYTSWRDSVNSGLLWVSADPGCGKSVLAKHLYDEELRPTQKRATCYFFFKDDNEDQKTASNALCALLHQLFTQRPVLIQHALEIFKDNGDALKSNLHLLWRILIAVSTDPQAGEIVCILDALDECMESELNSLLQMLCRFYEKSLGSSSKFCMKFLVTSRPLQNIESKFSRMSYKMPSIRLAGEEKTGEIRDEINLVIEAELLSIQHEMYLDSSSISHLRKQITKVEHRTYLWLKLIFELIRGDLQSVTKEGRQKLFGSIPDSVDACYTAILKKSTDTKQAKNLLRIVCAAVRPLSVTETSIALMIKPEYKGHNDLEIQSKEYLSRLIRNLCGLFVSVIDGKVYLLHQTAREFLLSIEDIDDIEESHATSDSDLHWKHSISIRDSNFLLAEKCMWYLTLGSLVKPDTFEPRSPDTESESGSSSETSDQVAEIEELEAFERWNTKLEEYHFFEYAATNWTTHFREARTAPGNALETLALDLSHGQRHTWFNKYWAMDKGSAPPRGLTDLHLASIFGLASTVRHLLTTPGIDINSPDENTFTPLHYAIIKGRVTVVSQLLADPRTDVNRTDGLGYSPLYKAVFIGNIKIVQQLLAAPSIEAQKPDNIGRTPLYEAISCEDSTIFELLIAVLIARPDFDVNWSDEEGWTVLHQAVYKRKPAIVQRLVLIPEINLNRANYGGYTPLAEAAFRQVPKIVELLLSRPGINPSLQTEYGETPLTLAQTVGCDEIITLLENVKLSANEEPTAASGD